jgi:TonB family protein
VLLFVLVGLSVRTEDLRTKSSDADRLAFEIVEVPDNVAEQVPVDPTNLVSDKATRAADQRPEDTENAADPFSDGDVEIRQYKNVLADAKEIDRYAQDGMSNRHNELDLRQDEDAVDGIPDESIVGYTQDEANGAAAVAAGRSLRFKSLLSDVDREGGLSFNTYNWDFAPYMLAMKRAIERHLFPPYAFTHMGLVSGTNVVRFVVMPDGSLKSLELLASNAHFSLDRTSVRAIESSVPFLPLPKDFPEDHLEVTARFSYVVRDER